MELELNEWTSRTGQTRRYVNNWKALVGLDVDTYNTGNISGATYQGELISNSQARKLNCKVWIDSTDQVHVDYLADNKILDADDIAAAVRALLPVSA